LSQILKIIEHLGDLEVDADNIKTELKEVWCGCVAWLRIGQVAGSREHGNKLYVP